MSLVDAQRILLCLRYGIGDLLMELPAIDGLRRVAAHGRITALGARSALELLEGDPRIDSLVSVDAFGFSHWNDQGSDAVRARFRRWYREEGFDWVLDPSHAVAGVGAVLWESPRPWLCDAGEELQSEALRRGLDGRAAVRYAVERGWGIVSHDAPPTLEVTGDARGVATVWLAGAGFHVRPVAALSPAASSPLKRWPLRRYAAIGRELVKRGWGVALVAGPDEQDLARAIVDALPRGSAANFGVRHLKQVAALVARCDVMVCNDTGLMHLASAVGTTAVSIFGPTSPRIYAPPGAVALGGEAPCRFRRTTEFGPPECVAAGRCLHEDGPCIDGVGVDAVIATIERGFGARGFGRSRAGDWP